ncbi:bifunctional 3-(3-hydroxy-phenyl)propionate/3-hydroxycinnamic acid hydroxylase [Kribbella sp. NPDC056951]|uniref:bifunctional 3-(3-hydroxy-phenyl)propionate/3-hydroxycinnamic acid hydroxylase n=1 Tax=Kribbella sp. NPDC056951 TaxID=3345978 RepID=UPI00363A1659
MHELRYDVAIVGYGPTGVTAANLLGAAGLKVVVVEKDPTVFSRARAISTDEEVLRIWQRVGLAERLKQDMLGPRPLDIVDAQGRPFLSGHSTPRGHGHPAQMFIYQPALEQVLRDGADRYPNVDVLLEHECLRIQQDTDRVELTLIGTGDDTVRRVQASYLIAADGGSSPVRGQLNIGYDGRTYEDRWVVIDTKMLKPWPDHDRLRFHGDPARPAVDCPTPLGHHRWEFPILAGEDERELTTDEEIYRLVARYGISRDSIKILRAVVYSHHVRLADRWRVGRVFLAGDAAHAMPPWIGQGMAAGVRDAANLCWKLTAVLRGRLPESILDSYETERKPHARGVTRRADFVGRITTVRRPAVAAARNRAMRAVCRIPGVNQALQNAAWIPVARYPAGFLATGRAAGWMIPQPWVTVADGTDVRLDDALGDDWVMLHAAAASNQPAWSGIRALTVKPAGRRPTEGILVDRDGILLTWMRRHGAATVVLRPDRYVYASAETHNPLPTPPVGLTVRAAFTTSN